MNMRRGWRAAVVSIAGAMVLAAGTAEGFAASGTEPMTVTVQANRSVGTISPGAVGVDTPLWNPGLLDKPASGLIRQTGIGMLEFNGGAVSDLYHWRDGSLSQDPDPADHYPYDWNAAKFRPAINFDQFEQTAAAVGADTLVHVNYGTGTPAEAADWVRYANKVKHYGVKDWAIGEEVWGNGSIEVQGLDFEPDDHQDKSPTAYANNVVAYAKAMKAVDPGIRIGVEVTGSTSAVKRQWDSTVLAIAGPVVDFVDFHYYPAGAPDATLLAAPRQIPTNVAALRQLVDANSGRPGHHVDLIAGETNSAVHQTPQQVTMFNALYLADNNLSLLENGVRTVAWWALYSRGTASTGDLGLLSSGDCDTSGTDCQPAADTPFPPYYAMRLFGTMARPGGRLLPVSSGNPLVIGHAVREPDGSLAVLLGNEDPTKPHSVQLNLRGYRADGHATVLSFQQNDRDIQSSGTSDATGTRTLPPYSLTVLLLHRAG